MNYVVLHCSVRKLQSIAMGTFSLYDLVRSKQFAYQGLFVPSLQLEVSSSNQNPIVTVEVSGLFNMQDVAFIIDLFDNITDVVVDYCCLVEIFFCSRRGEFIIIIVVHSM